MPHQLKHGFQFVLNAIATRLKETGFALYGIRRNSVVVSADQLRALEWNEIREQIDSIHREKVVRMIAIGLIASISALYLPTAMVGLSVAAILLCDYAEIWLLRSALDNPGRPIFYTLAIGTVFAGEIIFCFPTAVMWQIDDAFTKAISVGILSAALMRLATLRSIHPITGFAGVAAQAGIIAVSNSFYWLNMGSYRGLAFTSLIAITSLGYVTAAIIQNHRQIRLSAVSRMEAQQASAAKSYFLAQMSHELRTPLNAIIGMGTAAQLKEVNAETRDELAVLVSSAKGLGIILDDVLDIAAIEEGRINIRARVSDLRVELTLAVDLFRSQAEEAGIDLVVRFTGSMPSTLGLDFDRLRQCISNLISNSLKHTKSGQIIVSATVSSTGIVEIEVEDTGVGIPPGHETSIFSQHERRPNLTGGYGLGLSICRAIILKMNGGITLVPSTVGARLRITLPAEVTMNNSTPLATSLKIPEIRGTLVLVVDDIGTNRLVAATYLRILQCRVLEAASGEEAIRLHSTNPDIQVVLLDINMPIMDGLETLRVIRKAAEGGDLPVIAMTADVAERERRRYLSAGMDGYLSKPISLEALHMEIQRVLFDHHDIDRPRHR